MITKLVLIAAFIALNAFFVAAEFALVKTRASRIKAMADRGDVRARRLMTILDQLDLYLSACQLGITIASLVLGWLAEPAVATLIESGVAAMGYVPEDTTILHTVSLAVALTIVTVLHMVLGEQAPKIWAIDVAESAALRFALILKIYTAVFKPLIVVVNVGSNALLRAMGIRGGHGEHDTDIRELKAIIGAAASAGNISSRQRIFAENIMDLVELEVRHVMVPRIEVAFMDETASLEDSLALLRAKGHSRWPLCDGDLDHITGMVLARDVLELMIDRRDHPFGLREIARPPLLVPDTQPLAHFIVESQQTGNQGAIVVDEHGTVVGMVFLEDALAEIVGPLHDERDIVDEPYSRLEGGIIEMDGWLDLPEARGILQLDVADEVADTIGGLVVSKLGRLPRRGDEVTIGAYRAHVLRIGQHRRVERLRFEPLPTAES